MKKLLFILVIVSGCTSHMMNPTHISESSEYKVKAEDVGEGPDWVLTRLENKEVICYISDGTYSGALQCKWK